MTSRFIPPLYGLVLVGGKSRRMQTDKAGLNYHGIPQVEHAQKLLEKFCKKSFVSCRKTQSQSSSYSSLPHICDFFPPVGPLAGILSAMNCYGDPAWLVLACDLPYVDSEILDHLVKHRNPEKMATVFLQKEDNLPEPLCAIYEPRFRPVLMEYLMQGCNSPRKALMEYSVEVLLAPTPQSLTNVNLPKERDQAMLHFKKDSKTNDPNPSDSVFRPA